MKQRRDGGAAWASSLTDGMVRRDWHTWLPDCGAEADVHKSACIRHRKKKNLKKKKSAGVDYKLPPASWARLVMQALHRMYQVLITASFCLAQSAGMTCPVTHLSRTGHCMRRGLVEVRSGRVPGRLLLIHSRDVPAHHLFPVPRCLLGVASETAGGGRASCHNGSCLSTRSWLTNRA